MPAASSMTGESDRGRVRPGYNSSDDGVEAPLIHNKTSNVIEQVHSSEESGSHSNSEQIYQYTKISDARIPLMTSDRSANDNTSPLQGLDIWTVWDEALVQPQILQQHKIQDDENESFAGQIGSVSGRQDSSTCADNDISSQRRGKRTSSIPLQRLGSQPDNSGEVAESNQPLPAYDVANGTRLFSLANVYISTVLSVVCISVAITIMAKHPNNLSAPVRSIHGWGLEVLTFSINLVITLCMEGMGFVHSVSLRWALYRDGRLEFNTNIRLLSDAKMHGPNRWYMNVIWMISVILCYVATSTLFVLDTTYLSGAYTGVKYWPDPWCTPSYDDDNFEYYCSETVYVCNGMALCALGIGLGIQASVAFWCLLIDHRLKHVPIPTWSSAALNSTLTAVHHGYVVPRTGRCMMPVHQKQHETPDQGVYPLPKQGSAWTAHRGVRWVVGTLLGLMVCGIVWPIAVYAGINYGTESKFECEGVTPPFLLNWAKQSANMSAIKCTPAYYSNYAIFSPYLGGVSKSGDQDGILTSDISYAAQMVLGAFYVALIQGMQTVGLHCVELLVNLSRDEAAWRRASLGSPGAYVSVTPFFSAATSWENAVLFVAKALLHWIMGQSLLPSISVGSTAHGNIFYLTMVYSRLLWFGVLSILVAIFGVYLAFKKPKGAQPAAFGHIQTLADLIDAWNGDLDGQFWWGDKTCVSTEEDRAETEVRHAGTSCKKERLSSIRLDVKYASEL